MFEHMCIHALEHTHRGMCTCICTYVEKIKGNAREWLWILLDPQVLKKRLIYSYMHFIFTNLWKCIPYMSITCFYSTFHSRLVKEELIHNLTSSATTLKHERKKIQLWIFWQSATTVHEMHFIPYLASLGTKFGSLELFSEFTAVYDLWVSQLTCLGHVF